MIVKAFIKRCPGDKYLPFMDIARPEMPHKVKEAGHGGTYL
jgi:hypothetical protein